MALVTVQTPGFGFLFSSVQSLITLRFLSLSVWSACRVSLVLRSPSALAARGRLKVSWVSSVLHFSGVSLTCFPCVVVVVHWFPVVFFVLKEFSLVFGSGLWATPVRASCPGAWPIGNHVESGAPSEHVRPPRLLDLE